jgi:hypothetical protein
MTATATRADSRRLTLRHAAGSLICTIFGRAGASMSVDSINAGGVFRVGDVLSRAWRLFAGNLLFFLLVPVVIYATMVVAFVLFGMTIFFAGWASGSPGFVWLGIGLAIIVALSCTMIGQGLLLLAAFQRLRGQPLRIGEVLRRVLSRFLPLLGLSIVWGLGLLLSIVVSGFVFGLLAVVAGPFAIVLAPAVYVPMLILLVMWAVVVPACIVEGLGPIASMSRSTDLTKGYRWKIFGIMLLLFLISLVGGIVQVVLGTVSQSFAGIFALIWFVVWIAYWNCAIIMTYHDLRVAKEGIDTEQIAAIFD